MAHGRVIEEGLLPNGIPYRVWRSDDNKRTIGYIGHESGKRRSLGWLRKVLSGQRDPELKPQKWDPKTKTYVRTP